ncbi:MAG: hypothetical protein KW802_01420 [Candidatus Doudnabacteria bacterium]|nr:hypothetical protein [Candidatus Doudnabacteria bacterium]
MVALKYAQELSLMKIIVSFLMVILTATETAAQGNAPLMRLKRQWIEADSLPYWTDRDFPNLVRDGVLVKITDTKYHVIDSTLDYDAQYIRPFVLHDLTPYEKAFLAKFGHRVLINAAFRTWEHHADLRDRNPNAAAGNSPHSTGCTLDISLMAMTPAERRFTEKWFSARNRKSLVFTMEHRPLTMYDIFFRPPQPPRMPHHRHKKR